MKVVTHLKTAVNNLIYSPFRSFLTMLGSMVGTASIVALISSGNLATQKAMDLFKSLGTGQMAISFNKNSKEGKALAPNPELLVGMRSSILAIKFIAPYTINYGQVAYQGVNFSSNLIGTTPELARIIKIKMKQGRFFSLFDKNQAFCVIGSKLVKQLKTISPLGSRIRVGKSIFTIIGVADIWPENSFFMSDVNDSIIVPLNLMRFITGTIPEIGNTIMELKENEDIDSVKAAINNYFSKFLPGYVLNIQSAKEMIKNMQAQQQTLTLLLAFIGGVSLFVAGIGVMNIMLASVSERRYEIGLRLAIGAEPGDIQLMFLIEAAIIGMVGGITGVFIGITSTYFIAFYSEWNFKIFLLPPILGFSFSVLISMFFGYYPAYLASRLNPIEALKAS